MPVKYVFQLRRGPASEWTSTNPVLALGEPGIEMDTRRFKIGDGQTPWNDLSYMPGVAGPSTSTDNAIARWDGTNGALLQDSPIGISDTGQMTWPTIVPVVASGNLAYDSSEDTLVFYDSGGSPMWLGHTLESEVRNETGGTLTKGTVVYVSGGHSSGFPLVSKAKADSESTLTSVLGVCVSDIANNSFGSVLRGGILKNFDTSAWTVNTLLFVSDSVAGALTSTAPSNPSFRWHIGVVTKQNAVSGRAVIFSHPEYVDDVTVVFTDNTTGDVTTAKHGFVPKAPNDTTKFLRGDATWAVVPGASGGGGGGVSASGAAIPALNGFRLSLVSSASVTGINHAAVYNPQNATAASTDTTGDTVTFSTDPNWATGTIATPFTTGGGLTNGTRYYIRRRNPVTYSFHTTLAGAEADTGKVDLTASITSVIWVSGVTSTSLKLVPFMGSIICLYYNGAWTNYDSAEITLALGTLTSGTNYDVFAYYTGSAVTMELLAWTSDTVRATNISLASGVWVKSTDQTRRLVGTIRTDSTTTTIDDAGGIATTIGAKRFVWNATNRKFAPTWVWDTTSSWTYNSATWRQMNGAAGNKIEVVVGLPDSDMDLRNTVPGSATASNIPLITIGEDSTSVKSVDASGGFIFSGNTGTAEGRCMLRKMVPLGYHFYACLESAAGGTPTFFGANAGFRDRGMSGGLDC